MKNLQIMKLLMFLLLFFIIVACSKSDKDICLGFFEDTSRAISAITIRGSYLMDYMEELPPDVVKKTKDEMEEFRKIRNNNLESYNKACADLEKTPSYLNAKEKLTKKLDKESNDDADEFYKKMDSIRKNYKKGS